VKHVFFLFLFLFCAVALQASIKLKRIVSLTPSTTEMLFAIGAGPQVVGVTTADDYPPIVKSLPKIGGVVVNEEVILNLKPDLIVGERDLSGASLSRLKKLGLNVLVLHTRRLKDIPMSLEVLGKATGHEKEALKLVTTFLATEKKLEAESRNTVHPRVFLELESHPLLTAGKETFLDDLIQMAGGKNIADNLPPGFQMISPEAVVADNPQVIITADGENWKTIARRPGWSQISAVLHKRVYTINPDLLDRPGPRILLALKKIADWLHAPPQNSFMKKGGNHS
jgi:iron complex transport system substrate-binding protein